MIKVRVPATSANVGCGFDTLGLAVSLYTTFTFEKIEKGVAWEGCEPQFQNKENLIYTTFQETLHYIGKKIDGVKISIDCHVPVSRGLGSSSTCVIGGIVGAYALSDTPIDKDEILEIATRIEGHPDNVAPAIFGGLCVSCFVDNKPETIKYDLDDSFIFQALIPNFETLTSEARKALPVELPFQDAIYSLSHLPLVIHAFATHDLQMLKRVMGDKIHEPYRKKLIHEYEAVRNICESIDSQAFFISGSGSTLMNVLQEKEHAYLIESKLKTLKHQWKSIVLRVDNTGFKIL